MDIGAWWAAVCGVAKSRTRLKRLSSSSSSSFLCIYPLGISWASWIYLMSFRKLGEFSAMISSNAYSAHCFSSLLLESNYMYSGSFHFVPDNLFCFSFFLFSLIFPCSNCILCTQLCSSSQILSFTEFYILHCLCWIFLKSLAFLLDYF